MPKYREYFIFSILIWWKGSRIFSFLADAESDDLSQLYPAVKPSSYIYSLSHSRFKELLLSSYIPSKVNSTDETSLKISRDYPRKLDWRDEGVVSPVKNQKSCGGCWAFSTVETLESALAYKENSKASNLSVQEVLDCAKYSEGCKGGSTCSTLKWLQQSSVPVMSESDYPLEDKTDTCSLSNKTTSGIYLTDYSCPHTFRDEGDVLGLLYLYGPLIAGVDASTWNEYLGGIIQYHCGTSLNHAVQIVGYDLTGDVPYYIIRNSWGTDWGHDGYAYLSVGSNTCGITKDINVVKDVQRRKQ